MTGRMDWAGLHERHPESDELTVGEAYRRYWAWDLDHVALARAASGFRIALRPLLYRIERWLA